MFMVYIRKIAYQTKIIVDLYAAEIELLKVEMVSDILDLPVH